MFPAYDLRTLGITDCKSPFLTTMLDDRTI